MSKVLAMEGQILTAFEPLSRSLKEHSGSSALLGRLRAVAEDHIEGLKVRMLGIGVQDVKPSVSTGFATVIPLGSDKPLTPSAALQVLYTLLSHATFGYSVLHLVAHRQCDSGWGIEEGNTADLAEEHLKDYARALEVLHILVSDVAVWELSRDGLECLCVCPSCGLGICMCGTHGTATVLESMRAAITPEGGSTKAGLSMMSPPRADSVALAAGLDRGDVIVGVDEQAVGTEPDLSTAISGYQKALRQHRSGEEFRLRVRRPSGEVQSVRVTSVGVRESPQERRLAAIMFTDMVGFTALAQKDEPRALELLEEHRALVRAEFPRYKGREIKTMGDAFLLEFASALDAASCAIAIQQAVRRRNQTHRGERIQLRIGVHVGDLISVGGDIFGDAVNIASRIEPMAEPGGICVTQQVYDQVWNKVSAKMDELAKCRLKNVSAPVGVYRVSVPR
jgi:class 3 adenylate cyclase